LLISFIGPFVGIQWLTLLTAFGIAIVKAYLVAVNFMHINMTPRFVVYTVTTTLIFMLLFFAGTAPDVMKPSGQNWEKPDWIEAEAVFAARGPSTGEHGDEGHAGGH
jgi:caa(3)-type oxidase subunit IV